MTDPKAAAEAAITPATFNFAEAVLDRSYPEFKVPVYLDEASVQKLVENNVERLALEERIARQGKNKPVPVELAKKLEALTTAYEEAVESLRDKEYTVTIKGIDPDRYGELEAITYDLFPREYEETESPVTGAKTRTELPNEKRDAELNLLVRQAHLVSVTSPTGAVDADWSDKEKVRAMWARLPFVAQVKIDEAIQSCTIAVDFYRELVDEVF